MATNQFSFSSLAGGNALTLPPISTKTANSTPAFLGQPAPIANRTPYNPGDPNFTSDGMALVAPNNPGATLPSTGVVLAPDGSIDYKKSADAITASTAQTKTQANALVQQQDSGTSSFVSSSEPVVQQEKAVTAEARNYKSQITPPESGVSAAQAASDAYLKMIDDQVKVLEQRRKDAVANIESQFEGAKTNLAFEQKKETGTTTTSLARMGGFLGPSASAQGVLINLAHTHRQEVATLEAKKADAIQQANNAIDDKQFDLAMLKVAEVKDIEKTIHQRKQDFFNDSLAATQEARQQDEFYRTKIKDDLETLATLASADEDLELDPQKAAEIDAFYGVSGFTKQYLDVLNKAQKAADEKAQIENQKNLLELLEKIPAGQEVTFPDGTSYVGLGSVNDIYTTMQTDDAGVSRMVAYNKRTGTFSVTNVGAIGKSDSSGGGADPVTRDNVVGTLQIQLEAEKAEDGSYDPDTYMRERALIKDAFPGLVDDVDKLFLDPSNQFFTRDAIDRLRKKGVFAPTPSV